MGKAAVLPVVRDHIKTLRHQQSGRLRGRDLFLHYCIPIAVGLIAAERGVRIVDAAQVIAGAAILSGFSFGLAIFVFQLRLQTGGDPRIDKGAFLLELLDELFSNVTYAIVVGLGLTVLAVSAVSLTTATKLAEAPASGEVAEGLSFWWTWALISVSMHYLITLLMCVKRLRRAYGESTI